MRKLPITFLMAALCATLLSACSGEFTDFFGADPIDAPGSSNPYNWYVLAQPSDRGNASGIYLYEDGNGTVTQHLPLPAGSERPHSVEYDGTYLWLADRNPLVPLYKLNATTGTVEEALPSLGGTAMARANGNFWVARNGNFDEVSPQGQVLRSVEVGRTNISDMAVKGDYIYYAEGKGNEGYLMYDLFKLNINTGRKELLMGDMAKVWTMATLENDWAFVNDFNSICRFESRRNEMLVDIPIPIDGDITSISGGPLQ